MLKIILNRFKQGMKTIAYPKGKAPVLSLRYRGRPVVADSSLAVDLGKTTCSPDNKVSYSNDFRMAVSKREDLILQGQEKKLAQALNKEMLRIFGRSLKLRQVSAGGCNACELDLNVLNTVVFDLSRFGIQFVASPRHADGMVVTGPITRNMREALIKTYEAIPEPKIVIAVGACAVSGGIFAESPESSHGLDAIIPVNLYVPGCPPHPLTILDGLLRLLGKITA
ncbi:MAG: NADH-quinone oxidoreductase subunit B family protein [Candidatus Omnitrophica bacterium]|nr:NADH-quinone oxidoreductase subunit B family protein [Candidatus Omnitrophota bacterium]